MSAILVSSAIWMFIFRKMATWKWFSTLRKRFPGKVEYLWKNWTDCAYCGVFWIALIVRASTKLHSIDFTGDTHVAFVWILDALATAIGALLLIRILDALATYIRTDSKQSNGH